MEQSDVGDAAASAPGVPQHSAEADLVPDPALVAAVDDALIGDLLADHPEAQTARTLRDATDFSSLYIRHRSGLATLARRYLRDPRDVDEVVQETFLRLFLAVSEIETELQAIAFARRTLTNLCIDRYRADRRRPTLITIDANPNFDLTSGDEEADPVLRAEDAAIVREALARLSPLHRAALVKREIEEKALPQIAAELGVAEESVKHLLFRARRALRRLLAGTSVEPGIDLTDAEIAQGHGSPLLRGATVFILFLVGALVIATGIRPLLSGSGQGRPAAGPVGAGLPGLGGPGSGLPGAGAAPSTSVPKAHHPAAARHRHHPAAEVTSPSSGSAPDITIGEPAPAVHHRPAHHAPVSHPAPPAHFRLRGPLKVTGPAHVVQGGVAAGQGGSTLASSSFSALTDHGRFDLDQSLSASADGATSVVVTPSFVVGGMVEEPDLTGTAATVGTDEQGNYSVDLVANTRPDPSEDAFPLASVTAHLELSADLTQVLSETVMLATEPADGSGPVTVSSGPSSPPPSGSDGSNGPGSPAGTGSAGAPAGGTAASGPTTDPPSPPACPAAGPTPPDQAAGAPATTDPSACPSVAPESKVTGDAGLSAPPIG